MTDLYQVLGLDSGATEDQIRKAYRKRALQTHPDRIPPSTSPADKELATEEFRKISNAYEILSDPAKRQEYDRRGVWPPPDDPSYPERPPFNPRTRPYEPWGTRAPESHFSHPFDEYYQPHHFTDPFRIFEAFFGSSSARAFHDPFDDPYDGLRNPLHPTLSSPLTRMGFGAGSFGGFGDDFFSSGFGGGFGGGPGMRVYSSSSSQTHSRSSGQGGWVSESHSTRTINGVTESVWRRKDANGNEYVTHKYADGRERLTVNGIEQPNHGHGRVEYNPPPPPPPLPPYPSRRHRAGSERRKREHSPVLSSPSPPPPSYHTEPPPVRSPRPGGDQSPYIPPPPGAYPTDYHDERRYSQNSHRERDERHHSWWPCHRR